MRHALAALALVAMIPLAARGDSPQSAIPLRFRTAIVGSTLRMTWEATSDPAGGWEILRSSAPFSDSSFSKAEVIQKIPASQRDFTYSPTDALPWYYAILPLDTKGAAQAIFVPGKTTTAEALSLPAVAASAAAASTAAAAAPAAAAPAAAVSGGAATAPRAGGASTSPPASGAAAQTPTAAPSGAQAAAASAAAAMPPGIHDLTASSGKTSLTLSFAIGAGTGNVLVYRSQSPFVDATSLLSASLIATIPEATTSFADFPIPGVSNYYALVSESDLRNGQVSFGGTAATSASLGPVGIAAAPESVSLPQTGALARSYPLPSWLFAKPGDPGIGSDRFDVSEQAEKAIAAILAPYPKTTPAAPAFTVLQEDREQARGGEQYALSLIVQGSLRDADWKSAIYQLQSYLSLNRSPSVASRAHFYLGQAYAMTGLYRDAFFEFLLARDFHAPETRPWLLWLVSVLRS